MYRLNGDPLKSIHDWVKGYERMWSERFEALDEVLEELKEEEEEGGEADGGATSSQSAKVTLPTDEQLLITREFAAPKNLVYKAITTPDLVKSWWNAKRGEVTLASTT